MPSVVYSFVGGQWTAPGRASISPSGLAGPDLGPTTATSTTGITDNGDFTATTATGADNGNFTWTGTIT